MNFNISILIVSIISFFTVRLANAQQTDKEQIRGLINDFSEFVMASDYKGIVNSYTIDGKIFPNNLDILEGKAAIKKYWTLPEGVSTSYHKIIPEEIKIIEDHAYDYGYYEGTTKRNDGSEVNWKGKYVIVWKKVEGNWKIHLDIWNRIK